MQGDELKYHLINSYKEEQIRFLQNNPQYFERAVKISKGDEQPFCWRAAFVLFDSMEPNDPRIKPHIDEYLDLIMYKRSGHQREIHKILSKMELDDEQSGRLFDISFTMWESIENDPSIRITALKYIINTVKKYPELKNELAYISQERFIEGLSPGIRNSARKLFRSVGLSDE